MSVLSRYAPRRLANATACAFRERSKAFIKDDHTLAAGVELRFSYESIASRT